MSDAASFAALDDFVLRWRFTPPHYAGSSSEARRRVRPLTDTAALRIGAEANSRCADADLAATTTFRTDDSPGLVSERLRAIPISPDAQVLVSWNATTALLTDWAFFRDHWDDFCYPASDNVTIWSPDDAWTVCYRHFEVIQFRPGPR